MKLLELSLLALHAIQVLQGCAGKGLGLGEGKGGEEEQGKKKDGNGRGEVGRRGVGKNFRAERVQIGKGGGTRTPAQFKVEEAFVAWLGFFSFCASHIISVKSRVIRMYGRVWGLILKMDYLPTHSYSDG